MDGWITIGTQLNTNKFDRQVAELENKIKQEEEKQKINIDIKTNLEQEQAKINAEVEELTRQYAEASREAERLKNIVENTKVGDYSHVQEQIDYPLQVQEVEQLNGKLESARASQEKINEQIAKNNLQYQTSIDKVTTLKEKIDEISFKNAEESVRRVEASTQRLKVLSKTNKSIEGIQNGLGSIVTKVGKLALAVFSIRSAYNMIRQASSTLAQYNQQYATDLEYIRFVIAQGLAPVLEKIVSLVQTVLAYINYLAQSLFGVNIFANATADAFKKAKDNLGGAGKNAKELKKNLASFDELNVLNQENDSGALLPSIDIGGLSNVEIPQWLQDIANLLKSIKNMKFKIDTAPLDKFRESLKELEEPLKQWASDDLPKFLEEKAKTTRVIAKGLAEDIKMIGDTFLNNVLAPFLKTTTKYILPVTTKLATEIEKTTSILFTTLNNEFQRFWTGFIQPRNRFNHVCF